MQIWTGIMVLEAGYFVNNRKITLPGKTQANTITGYLPLMLVGVFFSLIFLFLIFFEDGRITSSLPGGPPSVAQIVSSAGESKRIWDRQG